MYALSFDMNIADLQQYYGEPYNGAYYKAHIGKMGLLLGARKHVHD